MTEFVLEGPMSPTVEERMATRRRPGGRLVMYQSWRELLFAHWRMPAELIQSTLPTGLTVDTFDGDAWVGVVPFFMRDIRLRGLPQVPGAANFQELNLRTYVFDREGVPGVWFYSLDANSWPTVQVARRFFHLPYHHSRMDYEWNQSTGRVRFSSHRRGTDVSLTSHFEYEPLGSARTAEPESLEFFLLERYVLFTHSGVGPLLRGRVHHEPYQYCDAAPINASGLFTLNDLPCPDGPSEHAVICRGVDTDIFALTPVVR